MKKIFAILILFVAILGVESVSGQAQARWGVTAGINVSNLKFDQNLFTRNQKVGAVGGLSGELMIPGIGFGFDAAVLYGQKGAKLHLGERYVWASQGYTTENCLLHYLEIPINLKFKYHNLGGVEDYIMPIIFVGPEFSFLLGHNKLPIMDYSGAEVGLKVGLGCELFKHVQLNASYCWGVTNALQTKQLDEFTAKNRSWKVTCTYYF